MSYVGFGPNGAGEAAFTVWHDERCAEHGIPFPGRDHLGAPMLDHQWTTAYAAPLRIDGTVCVAASDEAIAADPVLATLPLVEVRYPVTPGADVDENGDPISVIETDFMEYEKTLPPTWTDPETGTVYTVATTKD